MPADDTTAGLVVRALGPLTVQRDGADLDLGGTKQRLLLALLLIGADHVVSTDSLIDGLWGEDPPATARKALQMHVSNLRRALGEDFPLMTAPGGYVVQSATLEYDVTDFEAAVTKATAMIRTEPGAAGRLLSAALAAWRGPAFADLEDEEAIRPEIARLAELRLAAIERRIDADLRLGRHGEVVSELETLTLDHPFHERFREQQMFALYRSGRQAEALRAYDRLRTELVEQLGIEPSPALQTLRDQILRHASELDPDEDAATQPFAFLATDLEDSTALWEADPEAMQHALERHDALLRDAVTANAGSIFKGTGDGVYAVFSAATDAIQAGVDAQIALADEPWATSSPLRVRMAVDEGAAAERDGDYFGPVLNRVSRIMSSGHGGQLLVPATLASQSPLPARDLGSADYRGIGRVEVAQVDIPDLTCDFPPLRTDRAPKTMVREGFGRAIRGYELREQLGVGAYGIVFRAYQASIGREVAIKVIRPELANRAEFVKRFEAEAQYVAQLEHPHIVPLYDYWRDPDGAYLVMQMLRGGSLADSLAKSVWKPPAALNLLEQIGAALDSAHRQGVVHRDLKPANVLLDADGNAFLTDFGIAVHHVEAVGVPIESSVAYVSPEEVAGQPVGTAADMYGLALLTYEILTGARPELGGQPQAVALQRPELPPAIDRVLERGAHPDPAQRYARVADFLRDLRQAIGADSAIAPSDGPPAPTRNPFKGLRAFKETDAQDFYGRDGLVGELVRQAAGHRLTAVVGPSGCGKSSVVRAGLLPAVRQGALGTAGDVLITEMYPGSHPFEELESALLRVAVSPSGPSLSDLLGDERGLLRVAKQILPDDDSELLLVIDQFEELFSLTHDEAARRHFLGSLVEVIDDERSRVRIVITLRADYFDRPLEDPEFGALLGDSVVPVAMPRDHELAAAIALPAKSAGLEFEPGLVPQIVRDVADEPGALPLMQYALTALVDESDDQLLTSAEYEAVGGVTGALAARAEEIYEGMTGATRDAVPEVFLRLVRVDEHTDDTRRRARRAELDGLGFPGPVIEAVVAAYGSFRLLSFDRDPVTRGQTVEVAHEALIREWPRFGEWIGERRESLLLEQRLAAATAEWERAGRSSDLLITGGRLEQFETWSTEHDVPLPDPDREFLSESRTATDDAERRRVARRRGFTTLVAVLAALAGVAAVVALVQRNEANRSAAAARAEAERAQEAEERADAEAELAQGEAERAREAGQLAEEEAERAQEAELLAQAEAKQADVERVRATAFDVLETNPALAMLLAVEADRIDPSMEGKSVLHRLLTGTNGVERVLPATYTELWLMDGGATAVGVGAEGIDLWDVRDGTKTVVEIDRPLDVEAADRRIDVSDAGLMAIADDEGTDVYDLRTGEIVRSDDRTGVADVVFSPDGSELAVVAADGGEVWSFADDDAGTPAASLPPAVTVGWHPQGDGFVTMTPGEAVTTQSSRSSVEYWPADASDPAWTAPGIRYDWQRPMILFTSGGTEVVVPQRGAEDGTPRSVIRRLSIADGAQIGEPVPNRTGIDDWMWLDEERRHLGLTDRTATMAAVDLETGRQADVPLLASSAWTLDYSEVLRRYVVGGPLGVSIHDPDWTGPLERRLPLSVERSDIDFRGGPGAGYGIEEGDNTHEQSLSSDGERLLVSVFDFFTQTARFVARYDLTEDAPAPLPPEPEGLYRGDGGYTLYAGPALGPYVEEPGPGAPAGGLTMLDADLRPLGGTVGWQGLFENRGPSPDGRFFVVQWVLANSRTDTLYRSDGTRVADLEPPGGEPCFLEFSFSSDGSRLAGHCYAEDDWTIWDTETGAVVDQGPRPGASFVRPWLAGDTLYVSDPPSPDESEYSIRRLDPVTYQTVGEPLVGHRADRASIVDNGAGELIVSQSYQGDVRLWDRTTGEQVGRASQDWFGGPSRAVQLSDDGTVMTRITAAYVSVWNLDTSTWADVACEFAGRNMTPEEWAEFGPTTIGHRATCPDYPIDT